MFSEAHIFTQTHTKKPLANSKSTPAMALCKPGFHRAVELCSSDTQHRQSKLSDCTGIRVSDSERVKKSKPHAFASLVFPVLPPGDRNCLL